MILGNYQTYIGVLATFLVLCLYNNTLGNFILHTILKVGEGFLDIIKSYVNKKKLIYDNQLYPKQDAIRKRLKECKNDHNRYDLNKLKEAEKRINYILNRAPLKIQQFVKDALTVKKNYLDRLPSTNGNDREELTFVALSSLIYIIVTMVVDCLDVIPEAFRAMFIVFIIIFSIPLYYLYYSLFFSNSGTPYNPFSSMKENNGFVVFINIFAVFFILIVSIKSHFIFCILCLLTIMMGIHDFYLQDHTKKADQKAINHKFVIEHSAYTILFALICSCIFFYLKTIGVKLDNDLAYIVVSSSRVARYLCVIMFTSNSLFLPLLFGYYLMRKDIKIVRNEIDGISADYSNKINLLCDELDEINNRIDNGDYGITKQQVTTKGKSYPSFIKKTPSVKQDALSTKPYIYRRGTRNK